MPRVRRQPIASDRRVWSFCFCRARMMPRAVVKRAERMVPIKPTRT